MSEWVNVYAERKRANEESVQWAHRSRCAWTPDEDAFLLQEWVYLDADQRDEKTVSQCLERTIEACRGRAERLRERLGIRVVFKHTTTTAYIGLFDEPEDCFWSPDYYTTGE